MSDVVDLWAAGVYVASLEPRPRGTAKRLLVSALDLWCATTGGTFELTRAGDVVVRRRDDGAELLRVQVGVAADAASLLEEVRRQLSSSSPDAFRRRWGIGTATGPRPRVTP